MSLKFVATVVRPVLWFSILVGGAIFVAPRLGLKVPTPQLPLTAEPEVNLERTKELLGNQVIQARGSTSMAGKKIGALKTAFAAQGVSINDSLKGSRVGIEYLDSLNAGAAAFAFTSAPLDPTYEEKLQASPILEEDVVLFVAREGGITQANLTKEEACQLLRGRNVVQREEVSGTRTWVRKQCGGEAQTPIAVVPDGTSDAFKVIAANKTAIGYGTPDQAQSMVRPIPVDWPKQTFFVVVRKDGPSYLKDEVVPFIRQVLRKVH